MFRQHALSGYRGSLLSRWRPLFRVRSAIELVRYTRWIRATRVLLLKAASGKRPDLLSARNWSARRISSSYKSTPAPWIWPACPFVLGSNEPELPIFFTLELHDKFPFALVDFERRWHPLSSNMQLDHLLVHDRPTGSSKCSHGLGYPL